MTGPRIVIDDLPAGAPTPAGPGGGRSLLAGVLVGLALGLLVAGVTRVDDPPESPASAEPPSTERAVVDTTPITSAPASTIEGPRSSVGGSAADVPPVRLAAVVRTADGRRMVRWAEGRTTPVTFPLAVEGAVAFDASGRWLLAIDGGTIVVGDGRVLGPITTRGAGAAWHPTTAGALAWGEDVGDLRTSRTELRHVTIESGRFGEVTDLDVGAAPGGVRLLAWTEAAVLLAGPDGVTVMRGDGPMRRFGVGERVLPAGSGLVVQDARGVRVVADLARPDVLAFDAAIDAPVVAAATSPSGRTALLVAPLSDGLDPDRRAVYVFAPNGDVVAQVAITDASALAWSGETLWVGYTDEDGSAHLLPIDPSGVGDDLALGVDGRVEAIGVAREPDGATR